ETNDLLLRRYTDETVLAIELAVLEQQQALVVGHHRHALAHGHLQVRSLVRVPVDDERCGGAFCGERSLLARRLRERGLLGQDGLRGRASAERWENHREECRAKGGAHDPPG